jgi:GNAT superfamily N-acetyltransferase
MICLVFRLFEESMQSKQIVVSGAVLQRNYPIRRGMPEDLASAFSLVEEYFREIDVMMRDSKAAFAKYLESEEGGVWLAFDGKEPIGCIALHSLASPERSGEVKRLYVRSPYRKQGLANKLLRALEEYAVELRYDWLYLDSKDDLTDAIQFYQRHGYKRCERYNSNPQATIFMRKRLGRGTAAPDK